MNGKHYVGLDLTGFEDNGQARPISRVTLMVDDDNAVTAGDDTGVELAAECPHATQAMVNAILKSVKGYAYKMYSAAGTSLDPAAELGDGITAGGVYSVIAAIDDDGTYPDVAAPGEQEMEDEYPTEGPVTRAFNKKISDTRAAITKTAEDITLSVENTAKELRASIKTNADNIALRVEKSGVISAINQTAEKITINASKISLEGAVSINKTFQIDTKGYLQCTGGTVGGWTIGDGLNYDDGTNRFIIRPKASLTSDLVLYAGYKSGDGYTYPFSVSKDGHLKASNADITGKITATSGEFTGKVTANSGTVGGWTIGSNGISYTSENKLHLVTVRPIQSSASLPVIYIGRREKETDGWSIPFRVNGDGTCSATDFKISGGSTFSGGLDGATGSISGVTGSVSGLGGSVSGLTGSVSGLGGSITGMGGSFGGTVSSGILSSCNLGGTSLTIDSSNNAYFHATGNGAAEIRGNNGATLYSNAAVTLRAGTTINLHGATSVSGSLSVSGDKDRVIETPDFGTRCLAAFETPLPTFADYGTAALDDTGVCCITIDPVFAETADPDYLPTVFLAPYGEGALYVDKVEHDVVTVRGTPGLRFAWETRYAQTNVYVQRLRVMDFDMPDRSGEHDFDSEAAVDLEHTAPDIIVSAQNDLTSYAARAVDYGQAGYEYYTEFERRLTA